MVLFEQAIALAENEQVQTRVEKASMAVHRLEIEPVWFLEYPPQADSTLLKRMRPHVVRFIGLCHKYKMDRVSEVIKMPAVIAYFENLYGPDIIPACVTD